MLFSKINLIFASISRFILANGPGGSVGGSNSTEVGDPSGFVTFFNQLLTNIANAIVNLGEFLLRCLARLAYFIVKITLNLLDFMNIVIRELSGQASTYSLSTNASLEESDILFQFLFNELIVKILGNVFVFAFLLIIIFTIMAIVKQEWQAHITGELKNIKKIFKKVLQALFTMIIVPIVMIVGIVFSNVLLSSIMGAFSNGEQNYSIGAQIFSSASYEANRYRKYAEAGQKIPIVFDYDGGYENSVSTDFPTLPESSTAEYEKEFNEMLESGNFKTGQSTYNMFKNETFYTFDSIFDNSKYYSIYDGEYLRTKQIEYYAMADFLDFALISGGNFYVVNTEEVYMTTINYLYNASTDGSFDSIFNYKAITSNSTKAEKELHEKNVFREESILYVLDTIRSYDEEKKAIMGNGTEEQANSNLEAIVKKIYDGELVIDELQFDVIYNSSRAELINTDGLEILKGEESASKIVYKSRAGSTNEVTGAKYIICQKLELDDEGGFIYLPLRVDDVVNGNRFSSPFLEPAPHKVDEDGETLEDKTRNETFLLARGIFTSAGYPTAIRESGNDIVYFRQDPTMPSAFNFAQIFNYQSPSDLQTGSGEGVGGKIDIGEITEFLTGVDVSSLVPDIQINLNLMRAFTKTEVIGAISKGGSYKVNYSFVGAGFAMPNLYDELSINYVVLVFAAALLFKSLFFIIWGLIQRLYEITLLWITFPGFVSKHPLEDADSIGASGTSFSTWKEKVIERVLALYSIYISLAIILMLVPIVFRMDYIATFDISNESIFVFQLLNGDIANLVIKTMFVLVLFSMLNIDPKDGTSSLPRTIEQIVLWSSGNPTDGYLTNVGAKTIDEIKDMKVKAVNTFTVGGIVRSVKGAALNAGRTALNAVPGRALFDRAVDMKNKAANKANDAMLKGAIDNMKSNKSSDSDAEVIEQTKNLEQATKDHAYTENYRRAKEDYNRQMGDGKKDFRASRGKAEGIEKDMAEVAKYGGGGKPKNNLVDEMKRLGKKPRDKYKAAKSRMKNLDKQDGA